MKLIDIARAVAPGCEIECIGIRPGEKLHEVLLSEDEARSAVETDDMYVVQPTHSWWEKGNWKKARSLPDGFRYTSDGNAQWMTAEVLVELVELLSSGASGSNGGLALASRTLRVS